jgi:hypothetical protein
LADAAARVEAGKKAGSGGSQRLIYGPALRDDVYPDGLVGYELRQYSSSRRGLIEGTAELTEIIEAGRQADFRPYESVGMIQSSLAKRIAGGAPALSEKRARSYLQGLDREMRRQADFSVVGGASFGERFLFPLRDWEDNPVLRVSPDPAAARARVQAATEEYLGTLRSLVASGASPKEAIPALKIALGKWGKDAELTPLFDQFAAPKEKVFPPWREAARAERGAFVGKEMQERAASVRLLSFGESQALGIPASNKNVSFYNLKHDGAEEKWAASFDPADVKGASLVTQEIDLQGKPAYHSMIRIDFAPDSPAARLYAQVRDGLGREARAESLYLSVGMQKEAGSKAGEKLSVLDRRHAVSYQVYTPDYLARHEGGMKLETLPLKLDSAEAANLMKIYLERAHTRGGQDHFDLAYNGCAANCYLVVKEAMGNEKRAPKLVEWLLRAFRFHPKWSPALFRANRWVEE